MRLLLVPALALPLLFSAVPAHAGCDEETCYPTDCLPPSEPPSSWKDVVDWTLQGDPGRAVIWLVPQPCPQ